ncbi:MAG: hypothetical protein ACLP1Y_01060 [Candidatus Acidiferrales bacterium]
MLRDLKQPQVQDLRNHPAEVVEELRQLLASDAPARPDPQRADFYEVEGRSHVFFIYILPGSRNVVLLAAWPREEQPHAARARRDASRPISLETETLPC